MVTVSVAAARARSRTAARSSADARLMALRYPPDEVLHRAIDQPSVRDEPRRDEERGG